MDFLNIDMAKSYATEENLNKALARLHLDEARPMVVCNREGRFTAIFSAAILRDRGYWTMAAANAGFKTFD